MRIVIVRPAFQKKQAPPDVAAQLTEFNAPPQVAANEIVSPLDNSASSIFDTTTRCCRDEEKSEETEILGKQ